MVSPTQDKDPFAPWSSLPGGPAFPQLASDEPIEDAEAQEGQEEVGSGDPQHDAQLLELRGAWIALTDNSAAASTASVPKDGRDSTGVHEDPRGGGTRVEGLTCREAGEDILLDAHQKEEGPC